MIVSIHTGDVDRIFIDKSLSGKLSSENPTDGKWALENYFIVTDTTF